MQRAALNIFKKAQLMSLQAWRTLALEIAHHPLQLQREAIMDAVAKGQITVKEADDALDMMEAHDSIEAVKFDLEDTQPFEEDRSTCDVPPLPEPVIENLWRVAPSLKSEGITWIAPINAATKEGAMALVGHILFAIGPDAHHLLDRWFEAYATYHGSPSIPDENQADLTDIKCIQCRNTFSPEFGGQELCSDSCLQDAVERLS